MKRLILFAASMLTFMVLNAQEVCAFNADNALELNTDEGTALTAGTIIGETESIVAKIGADDTYRNYSFYSFSVNDEEITGGLQGSANPRDAEWGTPSLTLKQPVNGAFLLFEARGSGFLYVMFWTKSNKTYTVFEEETAISYTYASTGDATTDLGAVYSFTLPFEEEDGKHVVKNPVETAEQEFLKINAPEKYAARWSQNDYGDNVWDGIKISGNAVIKFPVQAGKNYILNGNGTKILAVGFAFSKNDAVIIKSNDLVILKGEGVSQCAKPTINFENGKIRFNCETEGVKFVPEFSTNDSGELSVKVYATKSGYENSDTATQEFTATGKFGDLNNDGKVDVADHVELTKIIMNEE